jgi:hypothetical protein
MDSSTIGNNIFYNYGVVGSVQPTLSFTISEASISGCRIDNASTDLSHKVFHFHLYITETTYIYVILFLHVMKVFDRS